jgi:hypothetical protein
VESEREKAIATGCDEFDAKPIEFEGLVATIRRVLAPMLVDHGLRIELLASDDRVLGRAQEELRDLPRTRGVYARTAPERHEVPERLARHDPGPEPNTALEICLANNREPIREEDKPLLQRGFHDCRRIVLTELGGGRSGARVFSAHATLDNSIADSWPQPFFAKIDDLERVMREHVKYQAYAPFVPFGLRPSNVVYKLALDSSSRSVLQSGPY